MGRKEGGFWSAPNGKGYPPGATRRVSVELWAHMFARLDRALRVSSCHHMLLSSQSANENDRFTFVPTEKSMTGDWFLEHRKLNMEETSQ